MQAVIYARISEDHERAESVPTQLANATRHAERMGWDVAGAVVRREDHDRDRSEAGSRVLLPKG